MDPRASIAAVDRSETGYPPRLAALDSAPATLWLAGSWAPAPRAVAVVGARSARHPAIELAFAVGEALGRAGVDVISGGAIGVDTAAHKGALAGSGATVAVLGSGIDVAYPERNSELFAEIVANGRGALVTQFAPGSPPRAAQFPARNQVIAGLAELVLVVEASEKSGSLITARFARALGRTLAAVPGSTGTERLLVAGAHPVKTPADVLAILDGKPLEAPPVPEDPDARRLYQALDGVPRDVGDLAFRAGLAIGTASAIVIDLELDGLAARTSGGRYVRLR
jgi:DNA processing protein